MNSREKLKTRLHRYAEKVAKYLVQVYFIFCFVSYYRIHTSRSIMISYIFSFLLKLNIF